MIFSYSIPQISVFDLAERIKTKKDLLMLDVRERDELHKARIEDERVFWIPLSELASKGADALPEKFKNKHQEIIIFCHHGSRSGQVVGWLKTQGWQNVLNMSGGIDAYAAYVEPEIGRY